LQVYCPGWSISAPLVKRIHLIKQWQPFNSKNVPLPRAEQKTIFAVQFNRQYGQYQEMSNTTKDNFDELAEREQGSQSATENANLAGNAARQSLKHEKALNKGLPQEQKTSQTSFATNQGN
jgi:hypothetical protein